MAINAAVCLAAGECIVMTKNIYNVFLGLSITAGILLAMLFMLGLFTPALIFLKAKFKKASLIYVTGRGQTGQFMIASGKFQGIADIKGVGPFIITENSHTIERKSKLSLFFAFGEFAATLPMQFAYIVQYLRDSGKKVTNIDDLAQIAGMKFDDVTKAWVKIPEEDLTEEEKKNIKEMEVAVQPYKTIRMHDLAYMFPFNITPALIESKTQHMIGLKMNFFNKMNMQYVMMFIMILMGTTLAAVIAFKFIKSGDISTTETRTIIERVVQASPVQNLTG